MNAFEKFEAFLESSSDQTLFTFLTDDQETQQILDALQTDTARKAVLSLSDARFDDVLYALIRRGALPLITELLAIRPSASSDAVDLGFSDALRFTEFSGIVGGFLCGAAIQGKLPVYNSDDDDVTYTSILDESRSASLIFKAMGVPLEVLQHIDSLFETRSDAHEFITQFQTLLETATTSDVDFLAEIFRNKQATPPPSTKRNKL